MRLNIKSLLTGLLVTFIIAGCGDTPASDNAPKQKEQPTAITGVVAIGAPLVSDIRLIGAKGNTLTTQSATDGTFNFNVANLTAPFMLKATTQDGLILYSVVELFEGHANITPLTTYILDKVARANNLGGGVTQLFNAFVTHVSALKDLKEQTNLLNRALASIAGTNFDHFNGLFTADHSGYDAVLDNLDIEMHGDDVVIRTDTEILDTLPYDIEDLDISVTGRIYNALDDSPIEGVLLTFVNNHQSFSTTTNSNGQYTLVLENFRTYNITISANGFNPVVYNHVSSFSLSSIATELVPLIDETITGTGTISGTIINARSLVGLEGVTLNLREGINNKDGDIIISVTTDTDGVYTILQETGVYTAEISLESYTSVYKTIAVIGDHEENMVAIPLVTQAQAITLDGAFATIVLSWTEHPSDLDTFLTGPNNVLSSSTSGQRFKLAFYQQSYNTNGSYNRPNDFNVSNPCASEGVIASIDVDDTSSYGPETTSICQVEEGIYSYYVHHFSGSSSITDSPAEVVVSTASGLTQHFVAPAGATGTDSDVWHVFNLDHNGNIIPINTFLPNGRDDIAGENSENGEGEGEERVQAPSRSNPLFAYDKDLLKNLPSK